MITVIIAIASIWLICSALSYAISFAYFQRSLEIPSLAEKMVRKDAATAMLFGLMFGPFGLVLAFFLSGFVEFGLKWRIRAEGVPKTVYVNHPGAVENKRPEKP